MSTTKASIMVWNSNQVIQTLVLVWRYHIPAQLKAPEIVKIYKLLAVKFDEKATIVKLQIPKSEQGNLYDQWSGLSYHLLWAFTETRSMFQQISSFSCCLLNIHHNILPGWKFYKCVYFVSPVTVIRKSLQVDYQGVWKWPQVKLLSCLLVLLTLWTIPSKYDSKLFTLA